MVSAFSRVRFPPVARWDWETLIAGFFDDGGVIRRDECPLCDDAADNG